jgi:hypothetical protein
MIVRSAASSIPHADRSQRSTAETLAVETAAFELRRLLAASAIDDLSDLAINVHGLAPDAVQAALAAGVERAATAIENRRKRLSEARR